MCGLPRRWLLALGWSVALLGLQATGHAAPFVVTTTNDAGEGSLRTAIAEANATTAPDTITFAETVAGEITLQTVLPTITYPLTVQGPGAAVLTLNVNGTGRLLTFQMSPTQKRVHALSGLTLTGGGGNGGANFSAMLIDTGNDVTVDRCVVTNNHTTLAHGGAFAVQSGAKLTIRRSTVSHNGADQGAGVTAQGSGVLLIEDSTFHDNVATTAGGGVRAQLSNDTPITIVNSTFYNNQSLAGHGGAVYLDQFNLIIRNSTFYKNTAARSGGALFFYNKSTTHLVHTTIVDNTADQNADGDGNGGGIAFGDQETGQPGATDDIQIIASRSIIAKNIDTGAQAPDCAAKLAVVGANFVFSEAGCVIVGDGSSNAGNDPKLQATPALHGGPTLVFAPLPLSPIMNAGPETACFDEAGALMTTDQRGFTRTFDAACDLGAVEQVCGDHDIFGDEVCDDGNQASTDGCLATCVPATCGDGFTQLGVEGCDDGNTVDTDACRNSCTKAVCGDGIESEAESCDDGNTIDSDGCQGTCALPTCGDGVIDPGEVCDDGNTVKTDGCLNTCVAAVCGDGFLATNTEQCDTGADNSNTTPNACRTTCLLPKCGDGIVDSTTEACDDGNTVHDDTCTNTCALVPKTTVADTPGPAAPKGEAPDESPAAPAATTAPAAPASGCTLLSR